MLWNIKGGRVLWRLQQAFGRLPPSCQEHRFQWTTVFPASAFQQIFDEPCSLTASVFEGAPLSGLSPSMRGKLLARVAQNIDAELHPRSYVSEATPGLCVNGARRGCNNAEYDWHRDALRIECKSSQMHWDSCHNYWKFRFQGIKFPYDGMRCEAAFDELHLVFYTPRRLYLYRHDLVLGVSSTGKETSSQGHQIQIVGPKRERDWCLALEQILVKLDSLTNTCQHIVNLPLDNDRLNFPAVSSSTLRKRLAYSTVPLADLSPSVRGARIEALVRALEGKLQPFANISDVTVGRRTNGTRRSHHHAEYDWNRNGIRVECKSGQLRWDQGKRRWSVRFANIKVNSFDDLLLALYTPRGIYVINHNVSFRPTSTGKDTESRGCELRINGPLDEECWSVALDVVLLKLANRSCHHVAWIVFD